MPHSDTPFKGILSDLQTAPLVWRNEWPNKEGWWWHKSDSLDIMSVVYWKEKEVKLLPRAPVNDYMFAGPITPPEMPK